MVMPLPDLFNAGAMVPVRSRIGLRAALALLDQRQNRGNHVFEFGDPAQDGCRGQANLPSRILDQGVLRSFETVEQRSEVGGSVVHPTMLEQSALSLGK